MGFAKLSGALLLAGDTPAWRSLTPRPPAPRLEPVRPSAADRAARLSQNLRTLKLSAFADAYEGLARQCAAEGRDHLGFLLSLSELELRERERRRTERRIKAAQFPADKSLESFDLAANPRLDGRLVHELARSAYIARREHVVIAGGPGTGKTHLAAALGLAACRGGLSVRFCNAGALTDELAAAKRDGRLPALHRRLGAHRLLIVDELGGTPLSDEGAALLFEVFRQRSGRRSLMIVTGSRPELMAGIFRGEAGAPPAGRLVRLHLLDTGEAPYRGR